MWCLNEEKMVKSLAGNEVLVLVLLVMNLGAAGQMMFDADTSNEIFSQSMYDDKFFDFSEPSSQYEFNITSFHQSVLTRDYNMNDKTTSQGLDITSPNLFQSKTSIQLNAVFPGTVWCGLGNLAGNTQNLGFFANTDNCCRTHDNCPLTISPGETKFGLTNTGYFSRSHCMCDERFYYCLKETNSIVANKVGFTYFNLLRPQCFQRDFPIAACLRWLNERCLVYIVDQTDDQDWQWFDNKEF